MTGFVFGLIVGSLMQSVFLIAIILIFHDHD